MEKIPQNERRRLRRLIGRACEIARQLPAEHVELQRAILREAIAIAKILGETKTR